MSNSFPEVGWGRLLVICVPMREQLTAKLTLICVIVGSNEVEIEVEVKHFEMAYFCNLVLKTYPFPQKISFFLP